MKLVRGWGGGVELSAEPCIIVPCSGHLCVCFCGVFVAVCVNECVCV